MKVITPTGKRPEALKLLNKYLERQTFQDFEWIVLDDCDPVSETPSRCDTFIVSDWVWHGKNTQHRSILRLLQECSPDDKVVICEDDDWYSPDYLQKTSDLLDQYDVVGQKKGVYFNVNNQTYKEWTFKHHSSLCHTAFKGKEALNRIIDICKRGNEPIDVAFWRSGGHLSENMDCIGIKGMKGREGIGIGHKMQGKQADWSYLQNLIGDDWRYYAQRYFICASGPSLTQEDVDYIRGKGIVVMINNGFQMAPWADVVYGCDTRWWKAYPEAMEHKGRKISIQHNHPDVELWPHDNRINGIGDEMIHSNSGNSGQQAINMAYLLGAKEIILLGYDFQNTDGKSHWHGDHKRGLGNGAPHEPRIKHMRIAAQQLSEKGVKVINCTRETALDCFERKNLEDVC